MTRKRLLDGLNRGPWRPEEDLLLKNYIEANGVGRWSTLPQKAGLMRSGKSCRLRWMNYLRPNVKRGHISADEEDLIIRLHKLLGNRWSLIAARFPGRTDNDVKNYWNIHLSKKLAGKGKGLNASKSQEKESSNKKIQSFGEQYNKGAGDSIVGKAASQSSALKSLNLHKLKASTTDSRTVPAEFKQEYPSDESNSSEWSGRHAPPLEYDTSTNSNVHRTSKIRSEKHELQNSVGILSDIIESFQAATTSDQYHNHRETIHSTIEGSPDTDPESLWFDSLPWLDSSYEGDKLYCNYDFDSTTVSPHVHPDNLVSKFETRNV